MTGALINAAAILLGGGIGLLLKGKINAKFTASIIKALGLCILIIGISGALYGDIMLMVVSIALGVLVGEVVRIDDGLNKFGLWIQQKLGKNNEASTFARDFVTTSLLFCVGAMAVVGSIDSGLSGDHSVIITKSMLDAIASIALASALGAGVLLSAAAVFVYQGIIELFSGGLQGFLSYELITQISAVGGLMILALGFNMVVDTKIKVANLLPAFLFAGLYYVVFLR
jgi:uncharacterized membrane protein YqgA involved in biofilm formation